LVLQGVQDEYSIYLQNHKSYFDGRSHVVYIGDLGVFLGKNFIEAAFKHVKKVITKLSKKSNFAWFSIVFIETMKHKIRQQILRFSPNKILWFMSNRFNERAPLLHKWDVWNLRLKIPIRGHFRRNLHKNKSRHKKCPPNPK
jgi:hypothetical protein